MWDALLALVYAAMAVFCLALNLYSGQAGDTVNLAISVIMFVIVGLIFLKCELGSFRPVNRIVRNLRQVTEKIRSDARRSGELLYGRYLNGEEELFSEPLLQEPFEDYLDELDRIGQIKTAYYKCDIEDYIGYELIDTTMHRNLLNQVTGAMTGLGILGTFVGLSLGLQSFNTGSTAEITNSIAPLMGGIKVAFHTSIYGMIFSLCFNYIYKRKLSEAEGAMSAFLTAYRKYVMPDTATDGINKLMELQQQQTAAVNSLAKTVGRELGESLTNLLEPRFEHFEAILDAFARTATKDQKEALQEVTRAFVAEMNQTLQASFTRLGQVLEETCSLQTENNTRQQLAMVSLQTALEQTGSTAEYLKQIREQVTALCETMEQYSQAVSRTQQRTGQDLSATSQLFCKTVEEIREVTDQVPNAVSDSYLRVDTSLRRIRHSLELMNEQLGSLLETIE